MFVRVTCYSYYANVCSLFQVVMFSFFRHPLFFPYKSPYMENLKLRHFNMDRAVNHVESSGVWGTTRFPQASCRASSFTAFSPGSRRPLSPAGGSPARRGKRVISRTTLDSIKANGTILLFNNPAVFLINP